MISTELSSLVVLLGRRDSPTDALEEYCALLAKSFAKRGRSMDSVRMPWAESGWLRASRWLWNESMAWRNKWVLVQYTALAWSRRGFPLGLLAVMAILKRRNTPVAIVFHDPLPFAGSRLQDRARRAVQLAVMRQAARWAAKLISTIPVECIPWVQDPSSLAKLLHIPVGSNIVPRQVGDTGSRNGTPTVIVFGVTESKREEATLIARVTRYAREAVGPLRLMVVGRGAPQAGLTLRQLLNGSGVTLRVDGVLPVEQVSGLLAAAHAQLFVRGGISSRRTSAIAGICCGLPVVGYAGAETGFPITEAGVRLVPEGDVEGLVRELILVLKDEVLRNSLRRRSREAARCYFSWDVIAEHFSQALNLW